MNKYLTLMYEQVHHILACNLHLQVPHILASNIVRLSIVHRSLIVHSFAFTVQR